MTDRINILTEIRNCRSTNSEVQRESQNLIMSYQKNNAEYLLTELIRYFKDNSTEVNEAQLCGLVIKNTIAEGDTWLKLSFTTQNTIRSTLLNIIDTEGYNEIIIQTACEAYSTIAYKEYEKNNHLMFSTIVDNFSKNPWYIYTTKLFFDKFKLTSLSYNITTDLLNKLFPIILSNDKDEKFIVFSIEIVTLLLPFSKYYFENNLNFFFNPILTVLIGTKSKKVKNAGLLCLYDIVNLYHINIVSFIDRIVPMLNVFINTKNDESIQQKAIEIYCLLCEKEASHKTFIKDYLLNSSKEITSMLLEVMSADIKVAIAKNDDWSLSKGCCFIISYLLSVDNTTTLLEVMLIYVTSNFNSDDEKKRFSSLVIFSCCLETPHKSTLSVIDIREIVNKLNDQNKVIVYTTSWVMGKISELHPGLFERKYFYEFIPNLINIIREKSQDNIRINIAIVLGNLIKYYGDEKTTSNTNAFQPYYKHFVNAFIEDCVDETNVKNGVSFYLIRVVMNVVQYSSKDLQDSLELLLDKILGQFLKAGDIAKNSSNNEYKIGYYDLEENFCLIINQIFNKIIRDVNYNLCLRIYDALINSFEKRGKSYETGMLCMFNLIILLNPNNDDKIEVFKQVNLESFFVFFVQSLKSQNNLLIQTAIVVFNNLTWIKSPLISTHAKEVLDILFLILNNPDLKQDSKILAISSIGDICLNIQYILDDFIDSIIPLLYTAFDVIIPIYNNDEHSELLISLLETFSMILLSLQEQNKERIIFAYIKPLIQYIITISGKIMSINVRNNLILLFGDILGLLGERIREFSNKEEVLKLSKALKVNSDEGYYKWMNDLVNRIFA